MTRVYCPDCGNDLVVGKLEDGSQTTAVCSNCSSELIVSVEEGEIQMKNTRDYSYSSDSNEGDPNY